MDAEPSRIRVEGTDAAEVERVARSLAADEREAADRRAAAQLRSPWVTGAFYLVVLIVLIALLLVAASIVSPWALPLVVIGSLLGVAIVGALQLRHDDRLSERGFVDLMALSLKRLPLIARSPTHGSNH